MQTRFGYTNPLRWTAALLLCTAVVACGGGGGGGSSSASSPTAQPDPDPGSGPGESQEFAANIRTTSFGIPHIQADDFAGLGYGIGYVQARDNLCVLAEDYLTINGQRAEFFGRDGGYSIPASGSFATNVDSDFFWSVLITPERIEAFRAGAGPQAVDASRGFAQGYNRYLSELRNGQHPGRHADCSDAAWVRPIALEDMLRRYIRLAVLASSSVFPTEIATASPPGAGEDSAEPDPQRVLEQLSPEDMPLADSEIGSNVYGLGPQATQNGQSMLFGNPHFPWTGTERLYQMHLTIPGEANIFGASLYGVPAVLIGFNEHLAWSHTVSTAFRFTFYRLQLNPLNPTQYRFDNEFIDMESDDVNIMVREQDGSLTEETRTLYSSRYGPMLELSVAGIDLFDWGRLTAYTLRDANLENDRLIRQFFEWNRADSLDEFIGLHSSVLGVPWVNTVATGPGQSAYYGDVTVVPNVPDVKANVRCATLLSPALALLMPGLALLDGSRSQCDWDTDEDAPAPGIFGPSNLPSLVRDDHVSNMNDSYWLTHPDEPLTGFAAIIGSEETERSLRTRLGILQLQRRLDGSDGLPGTGFNLENLQQIVLDSSIYSGELARDEVIDGVCSNADGDVATACDVLADWDLATNLDSVGGHVWREFWTRATEGLVPVPLPVDVPPFWTVPFSANDPVNTPRGLNPLNRTSVSGALDDAVTAVLDAGIALDAPMGEVQYSGIHGATGEDRIPIFGDLGNATGSFTVTGGAPLDETGYPVLRGNSYIQTVTWEPGCVDSCTPIAEGFVTYSQSSDPASPHFRDQTEAYSDKNWITFPFTEDQIQADPNLTVENIAE